MNPFNNKPVSARVLDAAIAWQLCLEGSGRSAVEQAEFDKWHSAHEEHARAWRQLGMLDQRFSGTSAPARSALLKSRDGVHQLLACGLALLLGKHYLPIDYWLADQRTATGEQRTLHLADGTVIQLNTHSALDVRFDEKARRIVLRDGEILIQTGHGSDPMNRSCMKASRH